MDEMKIKSIFMRNVVSKVIKKSIKKKLGYDIDIQLKELNIVTVNGKAHINLNVEAEIPKEDFNSILEKYI